jgi:hypothetical protein
MLIGMDHRCFRNIVKHRVYDLDQEDLPPIVGVVGLGKKGVDGAKAADVARTAVGRTSSVLINVRTNLLTISTLPAQMFDRLPRDCVRYEIWRRKKTSKSALSPSEMRKRLQKARF